MPEYPEYPKCDYYYDPRLAQLFGHLLENPTPGLEYQDLYEQVCRRGADEVIVGLYEWPFQTLKAPILHSAEMLLEFEKLVHQGKVRRIGFLALPHEIAYPSNLPNLYKE